MPHGLLWDLLLMPTPGTRAPDDGAGVQPQAQCFHGGTVRKLRLRLIVTVSWAAGTEEAMGKSLL
jgi:hypothetical protein